MLFCEFVAPKEEKLDIYFQSGACLEALETHVLLSFSEVNFLYLACNQCNPTKIEKSSTQNKILIKYFTI